MTYRLHNIKDSVYPTTPRIYLSFTESNNENDPVQALIHLIHSFARAKLEADIATIKAICEYLDKKSGRK